MCSQGAASEWRHGRWKAGLCWAMGSFSESPWNLRGVFVFVTSLGSGIRDAPGSSVEVPYVRKKENSFPITCCSGEAHRQLLMVVSANAENSGGLFLPSGFFQKQKIEILSAYLVLSRVVLDKARMEILQVHVKLRGNRAQSGFL